MRITRAVLRDFMIQNALANHYELAITDKKAMLFEFRKAIEWYEEEPH